MSGPFRRDARVEFDLEVPERADALRIVYRAYGPGIELPAYVAVLAFGTAATAIALGPTRNAALTAYIAAIFFGWMAWTIRKSYRAAQERGEPKARRRCTVRDDGLVMEDDAGRTFWSWSAVRAMRQISGYIVLDLVYRQAVVLPAEGEVGARLVAWLEARLPRATQAPRTRTLLLLAVLYLALTASIATVLPTFVAP